MKMYQFKNILMFGKWKKLYGKEYMGTVRSTFILDDKGNILKEFRNVKAKDHALKVLEALKEL